MKLPARVLLFLPVAACAGDTPKAADSAAPAEFPCDVSRPAPYAPGIPYVGVHGDAGNSDHIPCETASEFASSWHALEGMGVTQPNTFSPDGSVVYVTTTHPEAEGCTLHALDAETGSVRWCQHIPGAWKSSAEVDADGRLYLTSASAVVSLESDGSERWTTPLPQAADPEQGNGAVGLHFRPDGTIAAFSDGGVVVVLDRATGEIRGSLDIPAETGFVPPTSLGGDIGDLMGLAPPGVLEDFASIQYTDEDGLADLLGVFFGAGGSFSDNTVGVGPDGTMYAIGGGADPDSGAVVQVRADDAQQLSVGWVLHTVGGSATSPSVSPDGRWMAVADGATPVSLLNPGAQTSTIRVVDIEACDANTDADDDPAVCAEAHSVPMVLGPSLGSQPLLDDGLHYAWEVQVAHLLDDDAPDVRALQDGAVIWESKLPDGFQWSAVITVSDNHLIGTMTRAQDVGGTILTLELPNTVLHELVVLDRADGRLVFRAPVPDDSTATVTIGPDGALYVNMLGLLSILAVETTFTGGVVKFTPAG